MLHQMVVPMDRASLNLVENAGKNVFGEVQLQKNICFMLFFRLYA